MLMGVWLRTGTLCLDMHSCSMEASYPGVPNVKKSFRYPQLNGSTSQQHMPQKKPFGYDHLSDNFSHRCSNPLYLFPTISLPSRSLRITSTLPVPSTLTSVSTSYDGSSKTALFVWSTALPTWLRTPSPRPSHSQRPNTLRPISD